MVLRTWTAPKNEWNDKIIHYYSFKTFPRFWLVKTTRITHHNQLLLTKLWYWTDDVKMTSKVHPVAGYWTVDRENLGTRFSCLGSYNKMAELSAEHFTRFTIVSILSKNIARTARNQLDGQHLLFGVYLQTWADLYLLKIPNKDAHYRYELTSTKVSMSELVFNLRIILKE